MNQQVSSRGENCILYYIEVIFKQQRVGDQAKVTMNEQQVLQGVKQIAHWLQEILDYRYYYYKMFPNYSCKNKNNNTKY